MHAIVFLISFIFAAELCSIKIEGTCEIMLLSENLVMILQSAFYALVNRQF